MKRKLPEIVKHFLVWTLLTLGAVLGLDVACLIVTDGPLPSATGGFLILAMAMIAGGDWYRKEDAARLKADLDRRSAEIRALNEMLRDHHGE